MGEKICLVQVVSISYSWPETIQCYLKPPLAAAAECSKLGYNSNQYVARANTVFQKLGSRGVTIVVSSGDRGAAGMSRNCPLRTTPTNKCPQVRIISNGAECFFPEGCSTILAANEDCGRALDKLKQLGDARQCGVSLDGYISGNGKPFIGSSACTCDELFAAEPIVQVDTCIVQKYIFEPQNGASLIPAFPASSPYVTSVGATALARAPVPECRRKDVLCDRAEITAQADLGITVTSGGGFASFSETPDYQKAHVAAYFAAVKAVRPNALPPKNMYSEHTRGYPDVAFIGAGCLVAPKKGAGDLARVDGTSCSAPTFAGMISLLNGALLDHGKAPLGFLNPLLYTAAAERPEVLLEIDHE
jgi:subtilase family serine protease